MNGIRDRSITKKIDESEDGTLDLSSCSIERLSIDHKCFSHINRLDCSNNDLKYINDLASFPNCKEINASSNKLKRFSSFLPLSRILKKLNVADNQICLCQNLSSLCSLNHLNVSRNKIKVLPNLNGLIHLTYIDLSSNLLDSLPNLYGVHSLKELNLSANQISSLDGIAELLPSTLQSFDVSSNLISNLFEAQQLSYLSCIKSIGWQGNPCVDPKGRLYSYRPYLYSCCLDSLEAIDEILLTEVEILKGEYMHTQGRTRQMKNHDELISYLKEECPLDVVHTDSMDSFDGRFLKVLRKRQEYLSGLKHSTHGISSSVSPFKEWLTRANLDTMVEEIETDLSEQKENLADDMNLIDFSDESSVSQRDVADLAHNMKMVIDLHELDLASSHLVDFFDNASCRKRDQSPSDSATSNISSTTVTITHSDALDKQLNIPEISTVVEHIAKTDEESKVVVMEEIFYAKNSFPSISDDNTQFIARTTQNGFQSLQSNRRSHTVLNHLAYGIGEKRAAIRIQSWWRGTRVRRSQRLQMLELRLARCEKDLKNKTTMLDSLSHQCAQLSKINQEQMNWISDMNSLILTLSDKFEARYNLLVKSLLPVPVNLHFSRRSPSEILIQWKNNFSSGNIKGYVIMLDGEVCGTVRANEKVILTDLDPKRKSEVSICCFYDNVRGESSEILIIPPCEDVKEDDRVSSLPVSFSSSM